MTKKMQNKCPAPLHEECLKHHGHKGDPRVTHETCGAIGDDTPMRSVSGEWRVDIWRAERN